MMETLTQHPPPIAFVVYNHNPHGPYFKIQIQQGFFKPKGH